MTLKNVVSKNIKAFRLQRGLSQQMLASQANMTVRYVSYLENTEANITLDILERVAKGLGVTTAQIVSDAEIIGNFIPKPPKRASHGLEYAVNLLKASLSMIDGSR